MHPLGLISFIMSFSGLQWKLFSKKKCPRNFYKLQRLVFLFIIFKSSQRPNLCAYWAYFLDIMSSLDIFNVNIIKLSFPDYLFWTITFYISNMNFLRTIFSKNCILSLVLLSKINALFFFLKDTFRSKWAN